MSRQFKKRDKKFNKMTRGGLIEQNAVTKEEENISGREQDLDLRKKPQGGNIQDMSIQSGRHEPHIAAPLKDKRPNKKKRQARRNTEEQQAALSGEPAESAVSRTPGTPEYETPIQTPAQMNTAVPGTTAETAVFEEQTEQEQNGGISAAEPTKEHNSIAENNSDIAPHTKPPPKPREAERAGRLQFVKDAAKSSKRNKERKRQKDERYRQKQSEEPPKKPDTPAAKISGYALYTKPPPKPREVERKGRLQFVKESDKGSKGKKRRTQQNSTPLQQEFTAETQNQDNPELPEAEQAESPNAENKDRFSRDPPIQSGVANTDKPSALVIEESKKTIAFDKAETEKPINTDFSQPDIAKPYTGKPPSRTEPKLLKKPDKLQFSKDEQPIKDNKPQDSKNLEKLKGKADKYNAELEKACDKLPSKKKAKIERSFNDGTGKVNRRLRFETEILPQGAKKPVLSERIAFAGKGVESVTHAGAKKLHQKIYEVEHENVGVKAGHRTEQAAESAYRFGRRVTRSSFSHKRNNAYSAVEKLEKKAVKANIKYDYRKAVAENPQLQSNAFSRYMRKRRIKKQYAEAAREAKRTGQAVKKTGDFTVKAAKAVAGIIRSHPMAAGAVAMLLLFIFALYALFSSFGSMGGGALTTIAASSYIAVDYEIDNAELYYTEWETDLLMRIDEIEGENPGYDEYRVNVNNIGHNPYELAAFLTAMYQDFKYEDIEAVLREIFDKQYRLTVTEQVETRYRTVIKTDPATGEEYEDTEAYDWYVLNISVVSRSFTDVIMTYMNAEQREMYSLLMQTKGNRQYIDSPFDFNWLSRVSDYYGYRVHPIAGAKDYHKGVDIAVPTGTEIHAGHDGVVTFADYSGGYGYVAVIENGKGLVSKYAHCDSLLVGAGQEVKRGDIIAVSGNSGDSTGPHLHLEVIKDGHYLNPLYFAVTNDDGTYSAPVYGYPGEPMGDGSYAALIEEAEKHLGRPYVWGGSSPATSFDCSGFAYFVFNQSGVASFGRTTAQGLYNMSVPVSPSEAKPGDLVFFSGTYSTANTVTHVGIYVGNGYMIHAGDPIQYAPVSSMQSYFYSYGRIN